MSRNAGTSFPAIIHFKKRAGPGPGPGSLGRAFFEMNDCLSVLRIFKSKDIQYATIKGHTICHDQRTYQRTKDYVTCAKDYQQYQRAKDI